MTDDPRKTTLRRYLDLARDTVLWKLEGLSDYDLRRPLTPTGTNLLGVLKHLSYVEAGYFGDCLGRPTPETVPPWEPPNLDMYAAEDESTQDILDLWSRVRAHSDATIEALPLDSVGEVPWWPPERRQTTLHTLLVHEIAEWNRHAGQIDILRELMDGVTGYTQTWGGVPDASELDPDAYVAELQRIADAYRPADESAQSSGKAR